MAASGWISIIHYTLSQR